MPGPRLAFSELLEGGRLLQPFAVSRGEGEGEPAGAGPKLTGVPGGGAASLPLLWAVGRGWSWQVIDPIVYLAGHVSHRGDLGRSPGRVPSQDER